jgi:hypothetical protein
MVEIEPVLTAASGSNKADTPKKSEPLDRWKRRMID